jgi:hypothetical protein
MLRGAREHEMRVALRRGEEPLVAGEQISRAAARLDARRPRLGAVAAHVGAALFLGHAHADHHRAFLLERHVARVVLACVECLAQRFEQRRLALQHGDARERHGERAERTRLDLRMEEVARAARGHRAGARVRVGERVQPLLAQQREQFVPGRMEFDLVDALAARTVRAQFGLVAVGEVGECERLRFAQRLAVVRQGLAVPVRARARERLAERGVGGEEVVVGKRRRLVRDFVCRAGAMRDVHRVHVLVSCRQGEVRLSDSMQSMLPATRVRSSVLCSLS